MSPVQKEKVKPDLDDWLDDIDPDSLDASLEAGIILPQLKVGVNEIATVKVLGNKRFFNSDYGKTLCFDVEFEGMEHNLIVPVSMKFQLAVAMIQKGLVYENNPKKPDFDKLIGHNITVKGYIGNTKKFKDVKLYSVQIND